PLVLDGRIDLAIGALVGDHLAAPVEADERPVSAAHVLLELRPVAAAREPFHSRPGSIPRHAPAAAELDVIAAGKGELAGALLAVEPPGNIHLIPVSGVLVEGRQALEERNLSARAAADRIHEVTSHSPGRVRESIRKLRALGIQQNADR